MKIYFNRYSLLILCYSIVVGLAIQTYSVNAAQDGSAKICISTPWAYDSLGKHIGAVYMTIESKGNYADELMSASSSSAKRTEIHDILIKSGMAVMEQASNLLIENSLILKPNGLHIMLLDLEEPLKSEDTINLTLNFRNFGNFETEVKIIDLADQPPNHGLLCK